MTEQHLIPLWELRDQPTLLPVERRILGRMHTRVDVRYDEDGLEPIPLDVPICGTCFEPWGDFGCATVRALAVLAIAEHHLAEARAEVARVREALVEIGTRHQVGPDTGRHVYRATVDVDMRALDAGRMGVVEGVLMKLHRDFAGKLRTMGPPMERVAKVVNHVLADAGKMPDAYGPMRDGGE